uniref:RPGR-interacting protein 1 first C2 domain-containing protein n=1 Tax=Acrobeloides nanus TaxID=290746 RepID=A0A914EKJ9_9BILA
MPVLRPSVEKWNRGELEDQYHSLYSQNLELKKRNNTLEVQLKRSNSRIRRAITERRDANNNPELQERNLMLERENRLLAQKLKSLRHQLIVYTQPKAHNTTLEFLTGRSTGRPRSTRVAAHSPTDITNGKIPLKSTENQKSATLPPTRDKPRRAQTRPSTTSENARPIVERRPATSYGTRTEISKTIQAEESAQQVEDKTTIIRLHREVREKTEQIHELTFNLEKSDSKLTSLRYEYDRLVDEFERIRQKFSDSEATIASFKQEATRYNEASHRSIDVIEKELNIIKEENRVLKASNERLIANSLQQEGISQTSIKELQEVQVHVQELERKLAELTSEKRRSEEKIAELESEKSRLSSRYRRLQEKLEAIKFNPVERQVQQIREVIDSPSPPPVKTRHADKKSRTTELTSTTVLDKLYEDVASIVDSHLAKSESLSSIDTDRPNAKWRQMYEEVYSELEKVRNMLVLQHTINEKQMKEINLLNDSAVHYKKQYEKKLNELVTELDKRAKYIEILENQIKGIAGGDLTRILPSEKLSEISITGNELILKLTKLTLTESGVRMSKSAKTMLFLSLEFFDFELQTTPLLQGPETIFDYSSVYDVIISNLFIHYIETDGITIELFEVQGVNYEQWGSGTISLKRLVDVNTPANITGRLQIHSVRDPKISIAVLEYRLEVPFNLVKALNAQKRRITASTYLPIAEGEADKSLYNELIIQVHRAANLGSIFQNKPTPTTYIAYQIYDLAPHISNIVTANQNPEYNDTRSWTLPIGTALHQYLKTEELLLYVMEDVANVSRGIPSGSKARYGMVSLPLFPCARNQKLTGTFSLIGPDGAISNASIDVSVYWKYAYRFNDEDLEVKMPIPVKEIEKKM